MGGCSIRCMFWRSMPSTATTPIVAFTESWERAEKGVEGRVFDTFADSVTRSAA